MARPNRVVTPFVPGNQLGARSGAVGRSQRQLCTRALLTELSSIDNNKSDDPYSLKPKFERLARCLVQLALGYEYTEDEIIDGVVVKLKKVRPPDLAAILAVMNRTDGLPRQYIDVDSTSEVTLKMKSAAELREELKAEGLPIANIFDPPEAIDGDYRVVSPPEKE